MREAIAILLSVIMTAFAPIRANAAASLFTDVSPTAWYAEAVGYVSGNGLMSGTGGGRFSPDQPTTRAMIVSVLYRSAGSPDVDTDAGFPDVRQDYYTNAVNWAAANDIVGGYPNGNFGVNDNVTRQDMATILWRYAGKPTAASAQDFADESSIASYASAAVDWARANDIISGKGNNRFDPRGQATRADVATIMKNYLTMSSEIEPQPGDIDFGTEDIRGFQFDNVLHDESEGDIHFGMYVPDSYDGSKPYALFVTLPGYGGLHFQGVGVNIRTEDFGIEAQKYNEEMIVLAPQLSDWNMTSARQAVTLTRYILDHYNIDPSQVYLEGYSGGGETGSLVMELAPELFTAYLLVSSQWDGDLAPVVASRTPVYLATGEDDTYYGSSSVRETYQNLRDLYAAQGLSEAEINELVVMDLKPQSYFDERGVHDQHAGGGLFAHDEQIMGWLFGEHPVSGGDTALTAKADPNNSQKLYLWEEGNVPATTSYTVNNGNYFDDPDFRPTVTTFPVPEGTPIKGAVLVCAGGAFQFRSDSNEGTPVAQELSKLGYQSFVVDYRLRPYTQEEGALDLARAVRFVRKNAKIYGIDEQDIAVMGFSAGGILAGEELLHYSGDVNGTALDNSYQPDSLDKISADAGACGMIYSFYGRLSVASLDVEEFRSAGLPPTYFCYGTRDPFYTQFGACVDALREAGVQVDTNVLEGRPHGYGYTQGWIPAYGDWLESVFTASQDITQRYKRVN